MDNLTPEEKKGIITKLLICLGLLIVMIIIGIIL